VLAQASQKILLSAILLASVQFDVVTDNDTATTSTWAPGAGGTTSVLVVAVLVVAVLVVAVLVVAVLVVAVVAVLVAAVVEVVVVWLNLYRVMKGYNW